MPILDVMGVQFSFTFAAHRAAMAVALENRLAEDLFGVASFPGSLLPPDSARETEMLRSVSLGQPSSRVSGPAERFLSRAIRIMALMLERICLTFRGTSLNPG